jgi:hypothetical protein
MTRATESPTTPSDALLRETQALLAPLARLLIAHGVTYPQLAQTLKPVFLQAAAAELEATEKARTDSALSLLSGVHRKDIRALLRGHGGAVKPPGSALSFAAEVTTRWVADRKYLTANGRPRVLALRGARKTDRSFESLVRSVSKDFHPHSVLNELVRLGLAEVNANKVRLRGRGEFVPRGSFADSLYFMRANAADHLSATAANIRTESETAKPFLEHAVYADEITAESAEKLEKLSRQLWSAATKKWLARALLLFQADQSKPSERRNARTRFGAYTFVEPMPTGTPTTRRPSRKESSSRKGAPK